MSSFQEQIDIHFPGTILMDEYLEKTYEKLLPYGFTDDNTFACVSTCRDEIALPLLEVTDRVWGEVFNFSSLAGSITLGKTGFAAATSHAPVIDGLERYVFIAMPHIAISEEGVIGKVYRPGREMASYACGALQAVVKEIEGGKLSLQLDMDDLEQSLFKTKIIERLDYGEVPDLMRVTKVSLDIITEDLERLIEVVEKDPFDYAVLTGVMIHGPQDKNYVCPSSFYAVHAKNPEERIELSL